ncbi:MAG: hypothetical protein WDN75_13965 [Bacteroidota bacterium]
MPVIKRLCGLFFLFLIVFNMIGYYALFLLAQQQLARPVLQRIETNSGELGGNLIFAIPLEVPYSGDSDEYTRVEGEIMYHGEVYRLVKQKFHHNMLYVVCLKDDQASETRKIMADYSRLFSGQDADHADSTIKIINSLSRDYTPVDNAIADKNDTWQQGPDFKPFTDSYFFLDDESVFHPPQVSALA